MLVHDCGHLDARAELAALRLRAKDADLRGREILENELRHAGERARRIILEDKDRVLRAELFDFRLQGGRDFLRRFVGNDRDPLFRFHAQAIANCITCARN